MSYVTAVTDRVLSDATTPTAKGRMNIADWSRIYGNARLTSNYAGIMLGSPITFDVIAAPTTTTSPQSICTMVNTILANIERLRLAVVGESIPGTSTEIKDDWMPGINEDAPNYVDANLWESTVDAIWEHFSGPDLEVCPTLSADLIIPTGTTAVYVDCINDGDYDIILEGTAHLIII